MQNDLIRVFYVQRKLKMTYIFKKSVICWVAAAAFFVFSGCSAMNKPKSPNANERGNYVKSLIAHYRGQSALSFSDENLDKVVFEGDISVGGTNVKYQRGLAKQARFIAEKFDNVFDYVKSETGIDFAANPRVYLIRVQEYPVNLDIVLKTEDPNIFPLLMFTEMDRDDPNLIIAENEFFPYCLMHEITEMSLVYPDEKGVVKTAIRSRFLIFIFSLDSHTRWFREGFANYAGYIALEYLRSNPDENTPDMWDTALIHQTPFSSLETIGSKLFRWEQKPNQKLDGDYYSAALGLFLLVEDKFGRDAIRDIVSEFTNYKSLDGSDIIKIINTKLDTDIVKLIEDFKFNKLGIHYYPLTPALALNRGLEQKKGFYVTAIEPNSIADKAGIDANDVIVALNDQPITTRFDFEMALLDAIKQSKAKARIWTQNEGYKEIQLNLDQPFEIPGKKIAAKSKQAEIVKSYGVTFAIVKSKKKE